MNTYPFPGPPTETTCMPKEPRPLDDLLPAHWPTTIPAISSFPPWGGIGWRPEKRRRMAVMSGKYKVEKEVGQKILQPTYSAYFHFSMIKTL